MTLTTDNGEAALIFRDVAHCNPTPNELSGANRLGLTKLVIWVRDGTTERWGFRDGHWRAVRRWKKEKP